MKNKFLHITEGKALSTLYDMLKSVQESGSRQTGFGEGFNRWIPSYDLRTHLNNHEWHTFNYAEIRLMYKDLAKRGMIQIKQIRGYGILEYSVSEWHGYVAIGDYFIKEGTVKSF